MLWFSATKAHAQDADSARRNVPAITIHGYAEAYFGFDIEHPQGGNRPLFLGFNRENEFNLNLAFIEVAGAADRYRFKLTPALGSYMQVNYAAEPEGFRYVFEANAGIKLAKNKEIWLDAGVLPSPFGIESAVSLYQNTLTRSLCAEYSPYYLTGARLSFPVGRRTRVGVFAINGWQSIRETNRAKSAAWQVQHTLSPKLMLNYSGYLGDESPDSDTVGRAYRSFHDFYLTYKPNDRWNLTALFDYGLQNGFGQTKSRNWHTANLTANHQIDKNLSLGMRFEYFADVSRIQLKGLAFNSEVYGTSLDVKYQIDGHIALRLETRLLTSDKEEFKSTSKDLNNFYLINTAALSVQF